MRKTQKKKRKNTMRKQISSKRVHLTVVAVLFGIIGAFLMAQGYAAPWDDDDDDKDEDEVISLQVTPNPALKKACGLDIALVMDHSASIDQGAPRMHMMRDAMIAFVNALGATETQFSVTKFASSGVVLRTFTDSSAAITSSIASINANGYGTNWSDGLRKAQSTFDPRPKKQNLVIFATDGEPTQPSDEDTALREAVTIANTIKASGTRILVLGIGTSDSLSSSDIRNLQQISGPRLNTGDLTTTDVTTTSFNALASHLATFAGQACGKPAPGPGGPGPGTGSGPGRGTGTGGNDTGNDGSGQGLSPGIGTGGGGGSSANKQDDKPNPLPSPTGQGKNTDQPELDPSPFFDGKAFEPGSDPVSETLGATSIAGQKIANGWLYLLGIIVIALGVGGWFGWKKLSPEKKAALRAKLKM